MEKENNLKPKKPVPFCFEEDDEIATAMGLISYPSGSDTYNAWDEITEY